MTAAKFSVIDADAKTLFGLVMLQPHQNCHFCSHLDDTIASLARCLPKKTFIIAHHRNYSSDGKTVYPFYIYVPTAIFPSIVFSRMRIHRPFADLSGNTKQSEESVKRLRG